MSLNKYDHLKCFRKRFYGNVRVTVECAPKKSPCAESSCAERLKQARKAYHDLMTLQRPVSVSIGNRNVRYAYDTKSLSNLRSYIAELEMECGGREVVTGSGCGCTPKSSVRRTRSSPGVLIY